MFLCTCTAWTCTVNRCMRSLQGILPKHAATLPTMLRGGLKFNRPPAPSPLKMTAAWHFALKCKASRSFVSVWKRISRETNESSHQVKGFYFYFVFLLNLHGASCCRFNPLITVWAQINDTSEAPPDATEVQ